MPGEITVGEGLDVDHGVEIGYLSGRSGDHALSIGRRARLRSGTVIYAGSQIGDDFVTGHNVVVREECIIGDDVSVWTGSVIDYGTRIGCGVRIHTSCYVAQYSELEDGVFLAPGVMLANDLYPGVAASAERMCGPLLKAGAQLGVNVTVLPYVTIGAAAVIGAGSVVTRDVPDGTVAYGNPAVPKRSVADLGDIGDRLLTGGDGTRASLLDRTP